MSLKSYFPEQLERLQSFFISAEEIVRHLKVDPEMQPLLLKALARMDEDREVPHAFSLHTLRFEEPAGYFDHLLEMLTRAHEPGKFAPPFAPDAPIKSPARFTLSASAFANSLGERFGSLVFVLHPEQVLDPLAYRRSVVYLAQNVRSRWVKFLVLDARRSPILAGIETEHGRIGEQTLYLSPEEIERRVREDLQASEALSPAERRQYKGLLAGFAFSNKQYDEAARLQRAWASESEREGQPGDAAGAYYNLGNTLLAQGELERASEAFCKASELCIAHKVHALAPFVYVNLGVCLHRQNQFEQAFTSLKVARDMFKALKHKAGEAFVVDALAQMYALDGRNTEAEKSWRYCLSLYDGMTAPTFAELRKSGREDILAKLKRMGITVGRAEVSRQ